MKKTTIAATIVLVAALSACGTEGNDNAKSSPQGPTTATQAGVTASADSNTAGSDSAKAGTSNSAKETPTTKQPTTAPTSTEETAATTKTTSATKTTDTNEGDTNTKDTGSSAGQVNYEKLTTNGTFLTSDKSVMCVVYRSGNVMCAAKEVNYDLPQAPKHCAGKDYGRSITASPAATARFNCGSDYVYSSAGKVLPAGKTLVGPRGLTCSATASSVACDYNGKSSFIYSDDNFTAN